MKWQRKNLSFISLLLPSILTVCCFFLPPTSNARLSQAPVSQRSFSSRQEYSRSHGTGISAFVGQKQQQYPLWTQTMEHQYHRHDRCQVINVPRLSRAAQSKSTMIASISMEGTFSGQQLSEDTEVSTADIRNIIKEKVDLFKFPVSSSYGSNLFAVLMAMTILACGSTFAAAIDIPLDATTTATVSETAATVQPLSNGAIVGIFLVGVLPFAVATVEFWRRIAVGASFGTGSDQVVFPSSFDTANTTKTTTIGEDNAPLSSRGRRILGTDALVAAYLLFTIAGAVLALTLFSVLTSPSNVDLPPYVELQSATATLLSPPSASNI